VRGIRAPRVVQIDVGAGQGEWLSLVAAKAAIPMKSAVPLTEDLPQVSTVVRAANPAFLAFVAAVGVVVDVATGHGLRSALAGVLPVGHGLVDLLALAGIAAVLSNLVNNLPATLVLLGALGSQPQAAPVLAVLIGVGGGVDSHAFVRLYGHSCSARAVSVATQYGTLSPHYLSVCECEVSACHTFRPWMGSQLRCVRNG